MCYRNAYLDLDVPKFDLIDEENLSKVSNKSHKPANLLPQ